MWRLECDIGVKDWEGGEGEKLADGLKLAFADLKTYILMGILFGIVSSGSVTNFFPTVVQTLGFSNIITLLLTAPPYALAIVTTFLNSRHADVTGERFWHVVVPLSLSVVAFIIAASTTTTGPRYLSMMLMPMSTYSSYVVSLAWISNTLPRPPAKRAAALAAINSVSNASSIWTAFAYPSSQGPRYVAAMAMNCGMSLFAVLCSVWLGLYLGRLNKKLDKGERLKDVDPNSGFRYLL